MSVCINVEEMQECVCVFVSLWPEQIGFIQYMKTMCYAFQTHWIISLICWAQRLDTSEQGPSLK